MENSVELTNPVRVCIGAMSGCYVLFWHDEIVYVGQSINLFARVNDHRNGYSRFLRGKEVSIDKRQTRTIRFDHATLYFCPKEEMDGLERRLIAIHKPRYNVNFKNKVVPKKKKIDIYMLARAAGLGNEEWLEIGTRSYSPKSSRTYRRV